MKTIVLLLALETENKPIYTNFCNKLINNLLNVTDFDILVSTNREDLIENNNRVTTRNNTTNSHKITMSSRFNYNMKHVCFENVPEGYDNFVYLDCDVKFDRFNDDFFNDISNTKWKASRTSCTLDSQLKEYDLGMNCLFRHKIDAYKDKFNLVNFKDARIPSEHIFFGKYDKKILNKFHEYWQIMNSHLQEKDFMNTWGDGFEIGISANYAGVELNEFAWGQYLTFNGNKNFNES